MGRSASLFPSTSVVLSGPSFLERRNHGKNRNRIARPETESSATPTEELKFRKWIEAPGKLCASPLCMIEISKDFEFEAAHSLPHLPYTHKCSRLHGHSYKLRVTCAGDIDPELGWVIDYADISKVVNTIITAIDHTNIDQLFTVPPRPALNDKGQPIAVTTHKTKPSTAENLCIWFYHQLKPTLPSVVEIQIKETSSTVVVYRPPSP